MRVNGFLSEEVLTRLLAPVEAHLSRNPAESCALLIDILGMQGYSPEARSGYVNWHRRSPDNLCAVAVVTTNKLWTMVIAAIGITVPLRAFDSRDKAEAWLQQIPPRRTASGVQTR